ncbi:probable V-type proton ATPase subunit d 2 [Drosophila tropicalis]|uniref:probable V-type proton ATPase subunit d 2 n=1 Tax=Drosophila tropicalis TaxID=46794 RepID=UPI0035AB7BDF
MTFSFQFNAENGYLEGLTRGFKNGMLRHSDYLNLTQCENLDDIKLNIQGTEYGNIFVQDRSPVRVDVIEKRMRDKLLVEYSYIRDHSTEPLSTFLEYIRYPHMIDNVCLLVSGLNNRRPIRKLLAMCHPLGLFDQLAAINVAANSNELFDAILIDSPLAKYIPSSYDEDSFHDIDVEILRGTLNRAYLEDFYSYCKNLGGTTADVMCNILAFEADRRAITIAVNALNSELTPRARLKLFPTCGNISPDGLVALSNALDYDAVKQACSFLEYSHMFENIERDTDGLITLEDRFLMLEAKKHVHSYLQQFHFGVFYSYIKLKQLELRNVIWICECVSQRQLDKVNAYIPIPLDS